MKKGDIVTIYIDPLTKQKAEGQAQLIRFISEAHDMEFWKVKFLGGEDGDPIVHRFIKKKESSHDTVN
jgi:hypothetical protein